MTDEQKRCGDEALKWAIRAENARTVDDAIRCRQMSNCWRGMARLHAQQEAAREAERTHIEKLQHLIKTLKAFTQAMGGR